MTKHYVAEPDPSFSTSDADHPSWRLRGWEDGEEPWTIGQGMTQAEARACERALSELPGAAQVDEVARRRLDKTHVSVVSSMTVSEDGERRELPVDQPGGKVSSAPFVPYSPEDVAEVEKAARWLLERKLAPSTGMCEGLARAVLTLTEQLRQR